MTNGSKLLAEMNDRSREVFRRVVEGYLESGDPVGSRTLTRTMNEKLSAATIRNDADNQQGGGHSGHQPVPTIEPRGGLGGG